MTCHSVDASVLGEQCYLPPKCSHSPFLLHSPSALPSASFLLFYLARKPQLSKGYCPFYCSLFITLFMFYLAGAYPECSRLTPGSAQRSLLGVTQGTLVMFREPHGMRGSNPAQPCTRQTPYLLFQLLFQTNGYRFFFQMTETVCAACHPYPE